MPAALSAAGERRRDAIPFQLHKEEEALGDSVMLARHGEEARPVKGRLRGEGKGEEMLKKSGQRCFRRKSGGERAVEVQ